ncbi:MAG TPA: hypothetical protein VF038_14320, partial [Usitatibacter sp.]
MKRTFPKLLPGAVACAVLGLAGAAQARQLSYTNHLPQTHPVNVAMKTYFDDITKATSGDLTFQLMPGG